MNGSNSASESDYTYHVNSCGCVDVLVIYDKNWGGKSVTNNIGAVLSEIEDGLGRSVQCMPIIYRDSLGDFDGIRYQDSNIEIFNLTCGRRTRDETAALAAARQTAEV